MTISSIHHQLNLQNSSMAGLKSITQLVCAGKMHIMSFTHSVQRQREREGGEKKFKVDIYRMNHFIINALPFSDMKRVILLNCKN